MHYKRHGQVKNIKAEKIAINSLHLGEFELKNAKVFLVLIFYFSLHPKVIFGPHDEVVYR